MEYFVGVRRIHPHVAIKVPKDIYELCRGTLAPAQRELFWTVHLTVELDAMLYESCAVGTEKAVSINPRTALRAALMNPACEYVILVHNHPFSKRVVPSYMDEVMVERIKIAGSIIGVQVIDAIIIGVNSYYSFMEHGLIFKKVPDYRQTEPEPKGPTRMQLRSYKNKWFESMTFRASPATRNRCRSR